jgi:filamentous hemagglutinin family protein
MTGTGTTGTGTTTGIATTPTPASKNPVNTTNTGAISGTVVNAQTSQPIQGTVVVALEAPTTNGFVIIAQTTADTNGNFSFTNVPSSTALAVLISAQAGSNFFIPVIVAGGGSGVPSTASFANATAIVPGTNIGTIGLTLPSGQSSILVNTTSPNPTGLQEVVGGVSFVIPLTNPTVVAGQVAVPAFQAQLAGFNPAGMVFTPTSQITIATAT